MTSGALQLTGIGKAKSAVEDATWHVVTEKKDRLTIRLQFNSRRRLPL